MIVVKLLGGLGNQMFQYAIGRALSLKHKTELVIDDHFFEHNEDVFATKRDFELHHFKTVFQKASDESLKLFLNKSRFRKKTEQLFPFLEKYHVVLEKSHEFQPNVLQTKNNSYLTGYWQSEKYFHNIRTLLLSEFYLKNPINKVNANHILNCQKKNTVSIHIRRGDYVNITSNLSYHGVCSLKYYYSAINYLKNNINEELTLFVFTDDEHWVNENFKPDLPFEIICDNKGTDSFYDMHLMSICNHNIIANSSFSWWGAWLNTHNDKIVIAPSKWFEVSNINTMDVIPENWIKL